MRRIDVYFLLIASFVLINGVSLGIWMASHQDFTLAPVHAHINLVGWVSLALFGLAYRAYPALARTRLAATHFVFSATGGVVMPIGVYFAVVHHQELVVMVGAMSWLIGAVLFFLTMARMALKGGERFESRTVAAE